jgi:hypothetical protein
VNSIISPVSTFGKSLAMQPIGKDAFLEQATAAGIGYDPRYPAAQSLVFLPPNEHSRFWARPKQPSRWPHFVTSLLNAAGARDAVLACPRRGTWPNLATARHPLDRTRALISTALGVPSGWSGAIAFDISDRDRLVAILVMQLFEPINDLYVLPSSGTGFLQFSHHDVVHVSCPTSEGIESAVSGMLAVRYELPDQLPDTTFKQPAWMRPSDSDT